jgi:hypothetical protein
LTLTATNAAGHTDQAFTLTVTESVGRPTVTSVSPKSGPTTGGTTITITGTGFTAGSTVLIGQGHGAGTGAVTATVQTQTPTSLTAVTPPGKKGTWNVYVRTPNGTSAAVNADLFTYLLPRPAITSVSPNSGPTTGGTTITITGTGFVAGSTVLIGQGHGSGTGAITATVITLTSTRITAVTPPGKKGTWNVYVRTPSGSISAAVSADLFTYQVL